MELETARLRLREFGMQDVDALYAMEADSQVIQHVTYSPSTRDECERGIRYWIAEQSDSPRASFHLAVTDKIAARFIGWCRVKIVNTRHREGDLGYALVPDVRGKGYATEAAGAMLDTAFKVLNLHRVFATTDIENVASRRVLEKLGLQYEGTLRGHKWSCGMWRDSALYAILADEWLNHDNNPNLATV